VADAGRLRHACPRFTLMDNMYIMADDHNAKRAPNGTTTKTGGRIAYKARTRGGVDHLRSGGRGDSENKRRRLKRGTGREG